MNNYSSNKIEIDVNDWVQNYIGPGFKFRKYQLETIVYVVSNVINKVNNIQTIEAPTGSGKSLVNIISAGVLFKYYNITSYILCSDLSLWAQYEEFINSHPKIKEEFGIVKGQQEYICSRNSKVINKGYCQVEGGRSWDYLSSPARATKAGYSCANDCLYVKQRKKAIDAGVTLMTYAMYYYAVALPSCPVFGRREILFCDECHNIPGIISNFVKPTITGEDLVNLKELFKFSKKNPDNIDLSITLMDDIRFENRFYEIYYGLQDSDSDKKDIELLEKYNNLLEKFKKTVNILVPSYLSHKRATKNFTKDDSALYNAAEYYQKIATSWKIFFENYDINNPILKTVIPKRNPDKTQVYFKHILEDKLVWEYLLSTSDNCVLISATVGGIESFSREMGFKYSDKGYSEYRRIPDTFDYSKSPIYFLNWYKMSKSCKDESFPKLMKVIYEVCNNKLDDKGIIQTGSYSNAVELYDKAPESIKNRLLLYNNPKEKEEAIEIHKKSKKPTILLGPTLIEGIDLPGDLCRFIIILKVPYPSLADSYVKRKVALCPEWYASVTSNLIIQGIGRGVRYNSDYCETFILDACFNYLYLTTKDQYPIELRKRIKKINKGRP